MLAAFSIAFWIAWSGAGLPVAAPLAATILQSEGETPRARKLLEESDWAFQENRLEESLTLARQALELFERTDDPAGQLEAQLRLGHGNSALTRSDEAIVHFNRALQLSRRLGNQAREAEILGWIGSAHQIRGELDLAIERLHESLRIHEVDQTIPGASFVRFSLGQTYLNRGEHDRSREFLAAAAEGFRAEHDPFGESLARSTLGMTYFSQNDPGSALPHFERGYELARQSGDPQILAAASSMLGSCYNSLGREGEALPILKEALEIHRSIGPEFARVVILDSLGKTHIQLGLYQEALQYHQEALDYYRRTGEQDQQAYQLGRIGACLSWLDRQEEALSHLKEALAIYRRLGNRRGEALILNDMGFAEKSLSRFDRARPLFQEAVDIWQELGGGVGLATPLNNLGYVHVMSGEYDRGTEILQEALGIARELEDLALQALVLNNLGEIHRNLGESRTALDYFQKALALDRQDGKRHLEAIILNNIGTTYGQLGRLRESIDVLQQGLDVAVATSNRNAQATTLNNLGDANRQLGDYPKAVDYFEQAIQILRQVGNRAAEAAAINNLAECLRYSNRFPEAMDQYRLALEMARGIGLPSTEATVLNNLGAVYNNLGQYDKAAGYFEDALVILRRRGNRAMEARVLGNLAMLFPRNEARSLRMFEEALAVAREVDDPESVGTTLNNLALVYQAQGQSEQALASYQEALEVLRKSGHRVMQGIVLSNLGEFHRSLRDFEAAHQNLVQALRLQGEVEDVSSQASTLAAMMRIWREQNRPALAVFYGKQAINRYQEIRGGLTTLPRELQTSYLRSKEETYRDLADLLITLDRLPEAQQVLRLLKEEEYWEFVRRGTDGLEPDASELTVQEAAWAQRYREVSDRLATLGRERSALLRLDQLSDPQLQRLDQIDADLEVAEHAFELTLEELAQAFHVEGRQQRLAQVEEERGLMEDLRELAEGSVAIYTLVGTDKLWTILITPDFRRARSFELSADDLSRKVFEFRSLLQDPSSDPKPVAYELYQALIGDLDQDLRQLGARTLMWSLDGALRYLPTAALWDGEHYLVERFRNVVYTPASKPRLKDRPSASWKALGLGVAEAHAPFPALPAVRRELDEIINEGEGDSAGGVMPGAIFLDGAFSRESLRSSLIRRYPLLHIATHFAFRAGNEEDSFLLLGDGTRLSLADIKRLPNIFGGVDLLTLSACETAVGGSGYDGREVEGFAVLAQRQGAKAVLATLWQVEDESTALLMRRFYEARETEPALLKSEALRLAQASLLEGRLTSRIDPALTFEHPYFWAPFILIGNWL